MAEHHRRRIGLVGGTRYRHLLAATSGLVFLTVLLGVSTRAAGAGLACNANWPLCDGGLLNLLPATLPSAFEWIHRVVAGVTGIAILGVAVAAWRGDASPGIRRAVAAGALLLPLQVLLGRETVIAFTPPALAAHYWTAMAIYGLIVGATILSWADAIDRRGVGRALAAAIVLVPAGTLLSPPVVVRYSPPVQALHYTAILLAFAALLCAAIVGRVRGVDAPVRAASTAAVGLLPVAVFLGRQRIVHPFTAVELLHPIVTVLLFLAVVVAAALFVREERAGR